MILDCLANYSVYARHIYCVTSDSGANIVKSIELMDDDYTKEKLSDIPDVDINDDFMMNKIVECIAGEDWSDDEIKGIDGR